MGDMVTCPECKGFRVGKYGKTAAGLQKYKCLDQGCRRQFVFGSDHLIAKETKAMAERLLSERIPPAKVAKVLNGKISKRWIYQLARKKRND